MKCFTCRVDDDLFEAIRFNAYQANISRTALINGILSATLLQNASTWIKTSVTLPRHPKTKRLAKSLNISIETAIGHLIQLWIFCLEFRPLGLLTNAEEVATAAHWQGDAAEFVRALIEAGEPATVFGFLEEVENGNYILHDWKEYSGGSSVTMTTRQQRHREEKKKEEDASVDMSRYQKYMTYTEPPKSKSEADMIKDETPQSNAPRTSHIDTNTESVKKWLDCLIDDANTEQGRKWLESLKD